MNEFEDLVGPVLYPPK